MLGHVDPTLSVSHALRSPKAVRRLVAPRLQRGNTNRERARRPTPTTTMP